MYDVYDRHGEDIAAKESVKVKVWLSRGHHFFFQCHNDLYGEADGFSNAVDESQITLFCDKIPGLAAIYPTTDNVDFEFKPLKCTEIGAFTLDPAEEADFNSMCVSRAATKDPSVNMLDSSSYFNITRSAVFEEIYFRGEHALAKATEKTVSPARVPAKKCEVTAEPTGEYNAIELKEDETTLASLAFTCGDTGFNDVSIPMEDEEACESTMQ